MRKLFEMSLVSAFLLSRKNANDTGIYWLFKKIFLSPCQIANTLRIDDMIDEDFARNRILTGTSLLLICK